MAAETEKMSGVLRVRNWGKFQHYHTRRPPWIKLQHSLLDDYEYTCLPLASKALAPLLWLLASEADDGSIRDDAQWLSFRLHWSIADVELGLNPLIEHGFVLRASSALADRKQDATPEERRGETETETEKRESKWVHNDPQGPPTDELDTLVPKRTRGHATAISPDFMLTRERRAYALNYGVAEPEKEFEAFRAHHEAHGKTMKSWDAAWRTWVLNCKKFNGAKHGQATQRLSAVERVRAATFARDAEIDTKLAGEREAHERVVASHG